MTVQISYTGSGSFAAKYYSYFLVRAAAGEVTLAVEARPRSGTPAFLVRPPITFRPLFLTMPQLAACLDACHGGAWETTLTLPDNDIVGCPVCLDQSGHNCPTCFRS